jgi:hypothetical protein
MPVRFEPGLNAVWIRLAGDWKDDFAREAGWIPIQPHIAL